jgi:YD repeat-containing protein
MVSGTLNVSYTLAATSNRMTQVTTGGVARSFVHNANGDITAFTNAAGQANTLGYDPFGHLASHTRTGTTTTYTVNALDQRMAKSTPGTSSRYAYAGFNQLLAENSNGTWTSYIWYGSEPVALVRNNRSITCTTTIWAARNWPRTPARPWSGRRTTTPSTAA